MKNSRKITETLAAIMAFGLYIILAVAIMVHSKLAYVLVLLSLILLLVLLWKEKMSFMKVWAFTMLLYSVLVLLGLNGEVLSKKFEGNFFVLSLLMIAELFARYAGKIVIFFMVLGVIFAKPIIKALRIAVANWIYGPLPEVQGIVKRDKKVYFYNDYHTKSIQLIYRQGHKKKILDTYEMGGFMDDHYSLEWDDENNIIVRKYDVGNHKLIMEKQFKG